MKEDISRRMFIEASPAGCVALTIGGVMFEIVVTTSAMAQNNQAPDCGPRLNPEMVKQFVIVGHGDLNGVKKLFVQEPKLINAAWDWGGGDWETALGGAAHVGSKEVARYLLENGARLDVFAAAMLGKLEVVKAAISAFPGTPNIKGPHGITLLAHAKAGGQEALAVVEYLESLKPV